MSGLTFETLSYAKTAKRKDLSRLLATMMISDHFNNIKQIKNVLNILFNVTK